MEKKYEINISDLCGLNVKEAFEYYETYDFTKLKYHSNINNKEQINITLEIRNNNKQKGYVFYKCHEARNLVGYIQNIETNGNILTFNIVFFNTLYGKEYFKNKDVGFNITFAKNKKVLSTAGARHDGATLTTDENSIFIIYFLINKTGINKLTVIN